MKRIPRDPKKFEIIRIAEDFTRPRGRQLADAIQDQLFAETLLSSLRQARSNDILIYGKRTESMFAYVAGAMGQCLLIKEEDAGQTYATDPEIIPPDFRIVTNKSYEFLVEVKNCHSDKIDRPYKFKRDYLKRLKNYARLVGRDLKIAIFWSRFGLWSLFPVEALEEDTKGYFITWIDAMKRNDIAILGDYMIGTRVPLALHLKTDPTNRRNVGADGMAEITIKSADLHCAGACIQDPIEQQIAWFLMLNGQWTCEETPAEIIDGQLHSFSFILKPEDETPGQGFEIIGHLSQMVSRQYLRLTSPDDKLARLAPVEDPGSLGVIIPQDYKGKALPLWRFSISPKSSAVAG